MIGPRTYEESLNHGSRRLIILCCERYHSYPSSSEGLLMLEFDPTEGISSTLGSREANPSIRAREHADQIASSVDNEGSSSIPRL